MALHEASQYRLSVWCFLKVIEHFNRVTIFSNQQCRATSDHGFKVIRTELRMVLSGYRMAPVSDYLVRVMIRASQCDSAFRKSDDGLFMSEVSWEPSWPLLQQFIFHGDGQQLDHFAAHFTPIRVIVDNTA